MNKNIAHHLRAVTKHLYINPLEKCNLKCKICYTRKTSPILSNQQILEFVARYQGATELQTITLCGGEVFALRDFPELVNSLTKQGIFVQIITNGTLNTLDQFDSPNEVNVIVSLDGLPEYHDQNRGVGTFATSMAFLQDGRRRGFHLSVFSIVTKQNQHDIPAFEKYLLDTLGELPTITYHPRKPPQFLSHHPLTNIVGEIEGFDFLTFAELEEIMATRRTFPPKELGCYQISLMSDGRVFGCCEGTVPLGTMKEEVGELLERLEERLEHDQPGDVTSKSSQEKAQNQAQVLEQSQQPASKPGHDNQAWGCLGCSQPDFMCGLKQLMNG